jgi:site-specific recombinase XerD
MTSNTLEPIAPEAAIDLYLDHRRSEVSEQTLSSHHYRLKPFVQWCEENEIHNLNELTGRDLHAYRVYRRENGDLAPISLQTQLSTLRVFIGFCASIDAVPDGLRSKILLPTVSGNEQASQSKLDHHRADEIIDYLSRYHYASRDHVIFTLLWKTGMRSGTLRSFDLHDYHQEDAALDAVHRPDQDTPLKNGTSGERMIALSERIAQMLDDYIEGPRHDRTDKFGREPLITTTHGRPSTSTIRDTIYRVTRPCIYADCPHDRDPESCEATQFDHASKCPSSRSPHEMRSGAITAHLLDDVPMEIVSERMDVSPDVLDRHYDRRTKREQMEQRRKYL